MRRLVYTRQSREDLADIAEHIALQSGHISIALKFRASLREHCQSLARLPGTLGRARPELRPDIRSIPHGNHLIFFRYLDNAVEIVTVINASRDLDAHFEEVNDLP